MTPPLLVLTAPQELGVSNAPANAGRERVGVDSCTGATLKPGSVLANHNPTYADGFRETRRVGDECGRGTTFHVSASVIVWFFPSFHGMSTKDFSVQVAVAIFHLFTPPVSNLLSLWLTDSQLINNPSPNK